MFTNILIVSRTFLSIYSLFDILLQYISACIALKSRQTGVSNRGRMVSGSWVVVGAESNVDSCFLALCPNTAPYNTPVC